MAKVISVARGSADSSLVQIVSDAVQELPQPSPHAVSRLLRAYGPKLLRYTGVTCINVINGLLLLFFFHGVLGWPGITANAAAVTISTIPSYLLSRRWVWEQTGPNSMSTEVAPFWAMAFLGLIVSTLLVGWASAQFDLQFIVYAANLASFGVLWVMKFFVLEKLMWKSDDEPTPVATEAVATEPTVARAGGSAGRKAA